MNKPLPERVIIESPFDDMSYLADCIHDCIVNHDESPVASYGLYTITLNNRDLGKRTGFSWLEVADRVVVYIDQGVTEGMKLGIEKAESLGIPVEQRRVRKENCIDGFCRINSW
jgi:hypothetical protein